MILVCLRSWTVHRLTREAPVGLANSGAVGACGTRVGAHVVYPTAGTVAGARRCRRCYRGVGGA